MASPPFLGLPLSDHISKQAADGELESNIPKRTGIENDGLPRTVSLGSISNIRTGIQGEGKSFWHEPVHREKQHPR